MMDKMVSNFLSYMSAQNICLPTDYRSIDSKRSVRYLRQIPDEIMPVVNTYLRARSIWLIRHNVDDSKIRPLFFRMCGDYDYMSANNIRKVKTIVERNLGVKFSLRDCRRAFGQRYVDHDAAMADVSHLMGHKTTRTTEMYYYRRSDDDVFRSVKGKW